MTALHIVATMFSKPHFIHHVEPTHIKIAYAKLASFNSNPHNEGDAKLIIFLKKRLLDYFSKKQKIT